MKLKITAEVEWEMDPGIYRKGSTPEQIAEWERVAVLDDPSLLVWIAEQGTMTIKTEVIP